MVNMVNTFSFLVLLHGPPRCLKMYNDTDDTNIPYMVHGIYIYKYISIYMRRGSVVNMISAGYI